MSCHHRGPYVQRGRGFGSTLGSMFRGVVPALKMLGHQFITSPHTKAVLDTAKRSAAELGLNVARDTLEGKNVLDSVKTGLSAAKRKIAASAVTAIKKVKTQQQHFDDPATAKPVKRRRGKLGSTATAAALLLRGAKKSSSQRKVARRDRDLFDVRLT